MMVGRGCDLAVESTMILHSPKVIEKLEQLRTLSYGEKIHVSIARVTPPAGIDTDEDRLKVIEYLKQHPEA